jgi:tripartite-type tricarboxylate transporter receptor subunit TctC
MRSLGVAAGERNAIVPDWPAISETLPGFDFTVWNAMVGPPNMPRDMTNRLSDAVKQALQEQAVIDGLANGGSVPFYLSSDDLKTYIAAEVDKWAQVARDAKIEPQ